MHSSAAKYKYKDEGYLVVQCNKYKNKDKDEGYLVVSCRIC